MARTTHRKTDQFRDNDLPSHGDTVTVAYVSERSGNLIEKTGWVGSVKETLHTFTVDVDEMGEQILKVTMFDDHGYVESDSEFRTSYLGHLDSFENHGGADE